MTGLLHEKEFSRRNFIRGGGALIVGFSTLGALAGKAEASSYELSDGIRTNLGATPNLNSVDSWLVVNPDNTVTVFGEKVEYGQGTTTGLRMIAAEELGLGMDQIVWVRAETGVSPNQGGTYGSNGTASGGPQIRAAAAYANQALLGLASASLGVPVGSLSTTRGVISGGGRSVNFGSLLAGKSFNVTMPVTSITQGVAPAKPANEYTLVGTPVPRVDIPDKVTGSFTYMQNVRVPGMLHGRVVRPRGQAAYGTGAPIVSIDQSSIASIPGAQFVQRGNFLGVVAPEEFNAIQAASLAKVTWQETDTLPGNGNIFAQMRAQDAAGLTTNSVKASAGGDINAALASAANVVSATYSYSYNSHSPIGPNCSIAEVGPTSAKVLSSTQDIYNTQSRIANITGLPVTSVTVQYWDGGGTFGASTYADVADSAAIMSQVVGKPVRVQFMRWDEFGWDSYGPAVLADVKAGIDGNGNIVAYSSTAWGHPYVPYSGTGSNEMALELTGVLPAPSSIGLGSVDTSQATRYNIPNFRVLAKSVPLLNSGYLMASYIRSPLAPQNTFIAEQMIDELAHAAGMDPIAFRLQNMNATLNATTTLTGQRTVNVLNAVAKLAGWIPRPAASQLSDANVVTGRGVSITGVQAVVAEVSVNKKTGKITATHMYAVADPGLAVNPASIENQMSGNMVMASSRALVEEVTFSKARVTSLDFVGYPIMRIVDAPKVTMAIISTPSQPAAGAGEATQGLPGAALANAFFDATGVRIRQAPMTPARVRAVLAAGGSGVAGTK